MDFLETIDGLDIKSSSRHISGDEEIRTTISEPRHYIVTVLLLVTAVKRLRTDVRQFLCQFLGTVSSSTENDAGLGVVSHEKPLDGLTSAPLRNDEDRLGHSISSLQWP